MTFGHDEIWKRHSLKYALGYLCAEGRGGKIARIDLNDLSYQIYDYSYAVDNLQIHALTHGGGSSEVHLLFGKTLAQRYMGIQEIQS